MTEDDKLRTRIVIAHSVGFNPDAVRIIDKKLEGTIYAMDNFKGQNLCFGFDHVPTKEEAREKVKALYLCGVELDFDEEMKSI